MLDIAVSVVVFGMLLAMIGSAVTTLLLPDKNWLKWLWGVLTVIGLAATCLLVIVLAASMD